MHNQAANHLRNLLLLMRPQHYLKQGFVFAPLLFLGGFTQVALIYKTTVAALLFCLAASIAYIFNDIFDLKHDRQHPTKAQRPLAAGKLSISCAWVYLTMGLGLLVSLSLLVHPSLTWVLVLYLLLNVAYTLVLKNLPVLDIFVIASFFVLRVIAGAVALGVVVSPWMFTTTLALALYLATIKRQKERTTNSSTASRSVLKSYTQATLDIYANIAMIGALVFYSLFCLASKPQLVLTVPLVLYGVFRYQYVVDSKGMGENPVDVLFND